MSYVTIFAVAAGLAADSFAASLSRGCLLKERLTAYALLIGCLFGGAQALMPYIGWQVGGSMKQTIADWDHWVAFFILLAIGGKTIYEGMTADDDDIDQQKHKSLGLIALIITAIATSIDALAAGFGFSLVNTDMWSLIIVTGIVTFVFSFFGVHLGSRISKIAGNRVELLGGGILILIGVNILYQHLYAANA